ncbi:hypothetical protein [Helicobacter sp.]|nr:hypothetical protein [Helicobacter sp.]MDY5556568.1 hypothetical protein [Helicobacter sp.]
MQLKAGELLTQIHLRYCLAMTEVVGKDGGVSVLGVWGLRG